MEWQVVVDMIKRQRAQAETASNSLYRAGYLAALEDLLEITVDVAWAEGEEVS